MKKLLKEFEERLEYLESQEQTDDMKIRVYEATLSIIHIQERILSSMKMKSNNQEIERKFLIKGDFKSLATSEHNIIQGYISSGVRIRIKDDKGYITIKGKLNNTGVSRYEFEKEIDLKDANNLMLLCREGKIEKIRYNIPIGNHIFEVDEFHGKNEGLILAEVELNSEDEEFIKPDWLGEEVTGNKKYYNSYISKHQFIKNININ